MVDQEELARDLINVFRADVIIPVGEAEEVKSFPKKFPHLITPFELQRSPFMDDGQGSARSSVLDIVNALAYVDNEPEWKVTKERLRLYTWVKDDPLADVFLLHFGAYPDKEGIKIDYRGYLRDVTQGQRLQLRTIRLFPPISLITLVSPISLDSGFNSITGSGRVGILRGSSPATPPVWMTWSVIGI